MAADTGDAPARVQENDLTSDSVTPFRRSSGSGEDYGSITAVPPVAESDETEPSQVSTPAPTATTARLLAPDLLRGLLMILQSIDHASVGTGAWRHGQALESEADNQPVTGWNDPVPWTMRSLTHLCAPGFMFLMGFGIVLFGRSRSKLGWTTSAMVYHFFIRALVLFAVSEVLGAVISGFRAWLMNLVLMALAVDYLLGGLIWLFINASEKTLTTLLESRLGSTAAEPGENEPLLQQNSLESRSAPTASTRAAAVAFHVHNVVLAALIFVTIAWNIWLSPTGGHCQAAEKSINTLEVGQSGSRWGTIFDIWFYSVMDLDSGIVSPFPPLAWLSFVLVGILYARIYSSRTWSTQLINIGNVIGGLMFTTVFVLTRLLRIGNLSDGCMHMPEHIANPDANPYLTSFRSFFYLIKYPPDVAFFGATLAVNLFLLAIFGSIPARIASRIPLLLVFGKCALFFYITHFFVYTGIAAFDKPMFGHRLGYKDNFNGGEAIGIGNGPVFWLSWVFGLCIMYPLCYFYGNFKSRQGPNSIWRFF